MGCSGRGKIPFSPPPGLFRLLGNVAASTSELFEGSGLTPNCVIYSTALIVVSLVPGIPWSLFAGPSDPDRARKARLGSNARRKAWIRGTRLWSPSDASTRGWASLSRANRKASCELEYLRCYSSWQGLLIPGIHYGRDLTVSFWLTRIYRAMMKMVRISAWIYCP